MKSSELQELKLAWLAAEETGNKQMQFILLRDNPDVQSDLVDFIAAYRATEVSDADMVLMHETQQNTPLLPLTERAWRRALENVLGSQSVVAPAATNLRELRALRSLNLVQTARSLKLGVDVWKKFEDGAIDLLSLSSRQLERLSSFFQVSAEQFGSLLDASKPALALNRRQTGEAARSQHLASRKQSFSEALEKSSMAEIDKQTWLEEA